MFKKKSGFTVIEVVIVIAIVAIIAGIWYVSKNKAGADTGVNTTTQLSPKASIGNVKINGTSNYGAVEIKIGDKVVVTFDTTITDPSKIVQSKVQLGRNYWKKDESGSTTQYNYIDANEVSRKKKSNNTIVSYRAEFITDKGAQDILNNGYETSGLYEISPRLDFHAVDNHGVSYEFVSVSYPPNMPTVRSKANSATSPTSGTGGTSGGTSNGSGGSAGGPTLPNNSGATGTGSSGSGSGTVGGPTTSQ